MFRKQTRSYQSEGVEHSPFTRAAQAWDDRIGSARVQARNWRVMAFACMMLTVVLAGGLIYQAAQTRIEAYVVEIDPQGRPGRIELIDEVYSPTSAQIAFHVAELIRRVRGRPTDPVVLKRNWEEVYRYLAGDAIRKMNAYASRAEPFASAKRGAAVAVDILNVIQRSDGSFQVRWKETVYEHGAEAAMSYWTGLFTTEIVPPKTAETLLHNPLGVYVTDFSWSQEFTGELNRLPFAIDNLNPGSIAMKITKKVAYSTVMISFAVASFGCHSAARPDTVYLEAAQIPEPPEPVVKEVEVPVPTPQLRRLPSTTQPAAGDKSAIPELTLAEAREQATQGPTPNGFIEAVQTYDYLPGAVYEVYASPGRVTTIALRPGEELIAKAAGDTARWVVGDSHTGSGPNARTLLLVKPLEPDVQTNLIVSTNERVYQIDLKSFPETYHSAVRWHYPRALAEQLAEPYRAEADADDAVITGGLDLAQLDFGYRIRAEDERPAPPPWTPRRVFTDGRKTYIAFPGDLATMKAPPLFVLGRKGQAQLVNYRVKGNYYIVDRVIERAELRLGKDPQRIVRIQRISE